MKFTFPIAVAVVCLLAACSKSNDDKTPPEVNPPAGEVVKTGVYTINNMVADTSATSAINAATIYYSLEYNKIIPASQAQTANWDIAFTGIYNSSIAPNNGKAPNSPGFGGPGQGAVYLVLDKDAEAAFDPVKLQPVKIPIAANLFDVSFNAVKTVTIPETDFVSNDYIGLDHFMGTGNGYAYYDFYGALFPGNTKKTHIVYTLPRTVLVKTAKGKYAKLQITSVYKDSPADPNRDNKTGYMSFRYAIQMDGSKQLDISK
ncbi:HmuY family protein [Chitinophaga arvensicola]|uniref:HmuY protein n=1 Tax=Chitinophaga arvensicola TaxID=29529 RepID=A0A1I0QGX1_9BACT|nr:HmuY family protein [Chitinophaga arvensicola]SEW26385.1 HmuY protein [Chitinophaga arvensicola]